MILENIWNILNKFSRTYLTGETKVRGIYGIYPNLPCYSVVELKLKEELLM